MVELAIELFNPAGNPGQARAGVGPIGGQFIKGSSGAASKGKPAAKKAPPPARGRKAQLQAAIKADREKLDMLRRTLKALNSGLISPQQAHTQSAQAGRIGSASPTPRKKGAPARKGAAAISAKAAKAKAGARKPAKAGAPVTRKSVAAAIGKQISVISRQIAVYSMQAAALSNEGGNAIELVFDINQPRDWHGRWMNAPGGMNTPNMRLAEKAGLVEALGMHQRMERQGRFAYDGRPGDMGHIRAIMAAADNMRDNSTASTALHNAGRALAGRDMKAVRVHLDVAEHETRGTGNNAIVKSIRRSMQGVPTGTYERLPYGSGMAPRSLRARHRRNPGYYPSPTSTWSNVCEAIELANGTKYRYKHGWIRLEQAISSRYHGNEPSPRGRGTASAAYPDAAMLQVATGTASRGRLGAEVSKFRRSFRDAAGAMGGGMPR